MRSLLLLSRRTIRFFAKMVLVAIPAVLSSYYAYRAGLRDSLEYYKELSSIADQTASLMERQTAQLEHMRGEVSVLKMLAATRVGSGPPGLPLSASEFVAHPEDSTLTLKTRTVPVSSAKRLTTRN